MKRLLKIWLGSLMVVLAALVLMTTAGFAQGAPAKKPLTFQGKVQTVDQSTASLKVDGEMLTAG